MTKHELREQIAALVRELPEDYCRTADERICRWVLESDLYRRAETVFCYAGTAREIDTRPLLETALRDRKVLVLPRCVGKGIMEARRISDLRELETGKYGIPAPGPDCPLVAPEDIDLAVIPCCTGNDRGERLGYGGGFYDRYLPRTRCPKLLLCRQRLVWEEIPVEEHDLRMDLLVTEAGILPCRN